jgi:two-component system, NarL family, sensor kinase
MKRLLLLLNLLFSLNIVAQETLQKGITLYEKGQFDQATEIFEKLEDQSSSYPDSIIIQVKNNLGNIFADLGKNTKALKKYQEALFIAQNTKNELSEAKIFKNIGAIYVSWKNFPKAKSYYAKALNKAIKLNDDKLIGDCYNNLGTVYEQENQLKKAVEVYTKALHYYLKRKHPIDIAMVYSNLAIVYKNQGKIASSISNSKKALITASQMNDLWMEAAISNNLANSYREIRAFDSALVFVNQSLQLSKKIKAIEIEIMAYETLADIYQNQGVYKKALETTKKMQVLNQQFINLSQTKQVNELEVKYKTKQKELDNQRLRFEKAQVSQQNKVIIFSFIILFLILIIGYYFRNKIKQQQTLNQQQLAINKAIIESENTERFRIARDLHDSVGQMLSVVKMQVSSLENQQINDYLDQTISEVRAISHNLIPEALNFGLKRALEELVEKIIRTEKIDFELEIDPEIKLSQQVELNLFRILQELIGNSLKHAYSNQFSLKITKEKQQITILFNDYGSGINRNLINKSSGLGWKNIYARLNSIQGNITFKENPNFIEINLPYVSN